MAMKLRKAIQFRSMMDDLSKHEFMQVMDKIYDLNQCHLIKASMFHYFIQSSPNDTNDLDDINATISQIIQSREDTETQPIPDKNEKIQLHHLPSALIGYTASYLSLKDYISFEKSNRSIYIGCNSPNMLYQLSLTGVSDYSSINLSGFPSLKELIIPMHQFNKLKMPSNTRHILNDLETMRLYGGAKTDFDIQPFIQQNSINTANIKVLELQRFGSVFGNNTHFPINKIWRVLTKFPNIECLYLHHCAFSVNIVATKLKALYPNLCGLSISTFSCSTSRYVILQLPTNLMYLSCRADTVGIDNVNFGELRELTLSVVTPDTINNILKTAHSLHKIKMVLNDLSIPGKGWRGSIAEIFKKCKSLQYIEFIIYNQDHYIAIIDGIEAGLFATRTLQRDQFKINLSVSSVLDPMGLMLNISRIIRWLERPNIQQFMFIWNLNEHHLKINKEVKEQILNALKESFDDVEINDQCVVLTNKHCNIDGWKERWVL